MKRPDEVKSKSTKIVTSYNKPLTAIIVQQETILVLKFGLRAKRPMQIYF